jgi:hypothetical protein
MLSYLTFNTCFELLCFLTALFCLSGNMNYTWKLFVPYLFVICLTEITGIYLKMLHHANQWPYNILLVFQITVNMLMFLHLFKYTKWKIVIICSTLLLAMLYIYEIVSHGVFYFNALTYDVMCVLFVLHCLSYFYFLLNDEDYIRLRYSPKFWWVSGALVFYFGSTVVNIFRGKLSGFVIADHSLTYYIYMLLNMILYTSWGYSFICKRWLTRI